MPQDKYSYDESFQLRILACICKDRSFISTHRTVLSPFYFERDYLISIAKLVFDYWDTYKNIPTFDAMVIKLDTINKSYNLSSTVYNLMIETINKLYNLDITDIKFISDEVNKFGQKQVLKSSIAESIKLMQSDKIEDIRNVMKKALLAGKSYNHTVEFSEVARNLKDTIPYFNLESCDVKVVPTLFPSLNANITYKGMRPGELLEIIGHPGYGKSTLATNFGLHAALSGFEVDIVSTELNTSAYLMKIASRLSQMTPDEIRDKYPDYIIRMNHFFSDHNIKLRLQRLPMYTCTIDDIRSYLSTQIAVRNAKPGLLIVDSADHFIVSKSRLEKSRFDYGLIYGDLINLGNEYGFPVIITTQGNRASMGPNIMGIEADSESWYKPALCDYVLTINRTPEDIASDQATIFTAKVREGRDKFGIKVHYDLSRSYIKEL